MMYNGISNSPFIRSHVTYPFVYWDNMFTPEELDSLSAYFDKHGVDRIGTLVNNNVDESLRISKIKMHEKNQENSWIFDRLNLAIHQINNTFYGYDLNGYSFIQYGEYHATDQGKYDWHIDLKLGELPVTDIPETRKLSLSLLLNEPGVDFEGGNLEVAPEIIDIVNTQQQRGQIMAFPSWLNHRVTPITKGIRKSLVIWVTGPKFK